MRLASTHYIAGRHTPMTLCCNADSAAPASPCDAVSVLLQCKVTAVSVIETLRPLDNSNVEGKY